MPSAPPFSASSAAPPAPCSSLLIARRRSRRSTSASRPARPGPRAGRRRERSEARRIDRADVRPARPRRPRATCRTGARIAYHPATGRVRFLAGSGAAPLARRPRAWPRARGRRSRAARGGAARRPLPRAARPRCSAPPTPGATCARSPAGRASPQRAAGRVGRPLPAGPRRRAGPGRRAQRPRLAASGDVLSVTGELLPRGARVGTRPRRRARRRAERAAASGSRARTVARWPPCDVSRRGLAVHDARLMGGRGASAVAVGPPPAPRLAGRRRGRAGAVEPRTAASCSWTPTAARSWPRSRVIADVVRRVCDSRNRRRADHRCTKPYTRSEGQTPTGVADVDGVYRLMGVVDVLVPHALRARRHRRSRRRA